VVRGGSGSGTLAECFDAPWQAIAGKGGTLEAARQMVNVLILCREHDRAVVELAVRGALAASAHDGHGASAQASVHRSPPGTSLQPRGECAATEPARRARSVTSSAATAGTAPALNPAEDRQLWTERPRRAYHTDTLTVRAR
jgi:hypothetical protein